MGVGSESSNSTSFDESNDFFQTNPHKKFSKINSHTQSLDIQSSGNPSNKYSVSKASSFSSPSFCSSDISFENLDFSMTSEDSENSISLHTTHSLEAEVIRLKNELKQSMEMYDLVYREAIAAKDRARELNEYMTLKTLKLEEARRGEEAALALVNLEKQKTEAATEAAQIALQLAEMECHKRKKAELHSKLMAKERKKAMDSIVQNYVQYRKYTIEEVEVATDHFSNSQQIGEGGYGPVYRGLLDHTPVAIKVLRPDLSQGHRQFLQEVEVLSCLRHPHMVILVGACPEYGCLVYEYMENGSLEDRLFRKGKTPPIPWKTRFNIAAEIATALLFLHQTKPEPLVHRDLKPANILLDRYCVSKISDVGLSRLVPPSEADGVTQHSMTAAAGTFCYIDPEYQQTGKLGVESDVYSLGVMLLQIITAKPPMGLSHLIESAIEKGTFSEMLDPTVTDWPVDEALSFTKLALKCCEMRRRDRPDLSSLVLPELNRLRNFTLGNESTDYNRLMRGLSPHNSAPQIESHENQINPKTRWQQLKSLSRIWNLKSNLGKCSPSLPRREQFPKSNKKNMEGCWSFVSCSSDPNNQIFKKSMSFS